MSLKYVPLLYYVPLYTGRKLKLNKEKSVSIIEILTDFQVSEMRLELTRHNCHYPLKVARLPIPPSGHINLGSPQRREVERKTGLERDPDLGKVVLYQLSYFRILCCCGVACLSNNFNVLFFERKRDSNPRPRPWQGRALPTELFSRGFCLNCAAKLGTFFELSKFFCNFSYFLRPALRAQKIICRLSII